MPVAEASLANLEKRARGRTTPNKFQSTIKDMILGALQDVGGREYLARQAELNPTAFMGLVGKVLPTQLQATDGNGIQWVIRIPAEAANSDEWLRTYAPQHVRDAKLLEQHSEKPNGQTIDGKAEEPAK